jgi:uncharacterized protein YfaS (alpha-2-macroglobulin family)
MEHRGNEGWGTTNETAFSILALTDYLAAQPEQVTPTSYRVQLDGREIASGELGPGNTAAEVLVPAEALAAGTHRLTVEQDGATPIDYVLGRHFEVVKERIGAAGPLRVSRRYLRPGGGEITSARQGDLVEVHVEVQSRRDGAYLLVEDQLPAGLEALNPRLDTTTRRAETEQTAAPGTMELTQADHMELRADRVSLFLTHLPAGRTELVYLARATRPGRYTALPAQVEAMYDPASWGRSPSAVFEVRE